MSIFWWDYLRLNHLVKTFCTLCSSSLSSNSFNNCCLVTLSTSVENDWRSLVSFNTLNHTYLWLLSILLWAPCRVLGKNVRLLIKEGIFKKTKPCVPIRITSPGSEFWSTVAWRVKHVAFFWQWDDCRANSSATLLQPKVLWNCIFRIKKHRYCQFPKISDKSFRSSIRLAFVERTVFQCCSCSLCKRAISLSEVHLIGFCREDWITVLFLQLV